VREINEALLRRLGIGVAGVPFGVFPLFGCTEGVREALVAGLGLGSGSESPTAAKRDRFGEGGGRLPGTTNQYSRGFPA